MYVIEILFWLSVVACVYTLAIYPLLTLLLAAVIRKKTDKSPITPSVSFITRGSPSMTKLTSPAQGLPFMATAP